MSFYTFGRSKQYERISENLSGPGPGFIGIVRSYRIWLWWAFQHQLPARKSILLFKFQTWSYLTSGLLNTSMFTKGRIELK